MKTRVFIQPGQDFGVFVGGVVVHDKVKLLGLWGVAINRFEELQACRQGFSVMYVRVPRLLEQLRIAHGDGSFGKLLAQLAKIDVLLLDDWGLTPMQSSERHDLLEVEDDRVNARSTIITSQTLHYSCRSIIGTLG
jgi:hypothetical protein